MVDNVTQFNDYLAMLRRRKKQIAAIVALFFLISAAVAFGLPPVYRSTATILIEQQDIPPDLVRSTVTSYAAERIEVISQRVMSSANLVAIIDKLQLYADVRGQVPDQELVQEMRAGISRELVNADVVDPRSGKSTRATIAFAVSFDSPKPEVAKKVAAELASLYLEENAKSRAEKADVTTEFLADEAKRIGAEVSRLEAALADFKEKNAGRLPQLMDMNLKLMDTTEREIEATRSQIQTLEERKVNLLAQMSQVQPTSPVYSSAGERVLSPAERLRALQSEYLSKSAVYAPTHPDLQRMKREIDSLQSQVGGTVTGSNVQAQLDETRNELQAARQKYSADHPDVIRLERAVAALEERARTAPVAPSAPRVPVTPDNPAYIALQTQMQALNVNLAAERARLGRLEEKRTEYEARITETPSVEREYLKLTRDYENATSKYREIRDKQMQAQIAEQLERQSMGERFSLVDPPQLPSSPVKPNRPGILLLGATLSMAGGVGIASIAEFRDRTIRTARQIAQILRAPPLAVIGYIENNDDARRRKRTRKAWFTLALLTLIVILLAVHFFVMPLNELWLQMTVGETA